LKKKSTARPSNADMAKPQKKLIEQNIWEGKKRRNKETNTKKERIF